MRRWGAVLAAVVMLLAAMPVRTAPVGSERLSPALRTLAATADGDAVVFVLVALSDPNTNLQDLIVQASKVEIAGTTWIRGRVKVRQLLKLATRSGVESVLDRGPRPAPLPPDPEKPSRVAPVAGEVFRSALQTAPPYRPPATVEESRVASWWGKDFIGVQGAWDRGFRGTGVNVAVIDSGIDFAHPDLQGTQARVSNPASPHHGWPICFDGASMAIYFESGTTANTWYVDTSSTPAVTNYTTTATAQFAVPHGSTPQVHTYTFWRESVSGVYHFGIHPDTALKIDVLGNVAAAVLVVDHPDTANRGPGYNTVYVDLDGDYDFTDEKPCYRGDEISYRDVWNGVSSVAAGPGTDGYADVSGGLVYFIANGTRFIPGSDWLWGATTPPTNGNLVCFMLCNWRASGGNHGTLCASAVAARGIINGDAPAIKPAYTGAGNGMVQGPAPEAKLIAMGNFYAGGYSSDFYYFAALGPDGVANTGDEADIVSMSYGNGYVDNDTWDWESRFLDRVNRHIAPNTSWVGSTGNGGPGFSTVNAPNPPTGISIGASTQYDSCDTFDSIAQLSQVFGGDLASFSDCGPSADGSLGVHALANGAWGSGNLTLNEIRNGWTAWDVWGGTSRSCPEAAGVLALMYQAFRSAHAGADPDYGRARQLLMNAATDQKYDILKQGAGRVNALRSVTLANNTQGISVDPPDWVPGDYRGTAYAAYARLVQRGRSYQKTFTLKNHGNSPATVNLSDTMLQEFASMEFTINTNLSSQEAAYNFRRPDYLVEFHRRGTSAKVGPDGASVQATSIPAGTELVVFEAIYEFRDFDQQFNPADPSKVYPQAENRYRLIIYNWTDINGNGKLWDDTKGSFPNAVEPNEIDTGEYMRFDYGYVQANALKVAISDPLNRMADGIFVGIQHNARGTQSASRRIPIRIKARFFRHVNCPWLTLSRTTVNLAAGARTTFTATVTVPTTSPYGVYTAKIAANLASWNKVIVPVQINVAGQLIGAQGMVFGGGTNNTAPYRNDYVAGGFGWAGRAENGDGRGFFFYVPPPVAGDYLLTCTQWTDSLPTDIDTVIFGPRSDEFTDSSSIFYDPEFGPNTLSVIGGERSPGRPSCTFKTTTGGAKDYFAVEPSDGLHGLFLHNILFSGQTFAVPFRADVGMMKIGPQPLLLVTDTVDVVEHLTLTFPMDIPDLWVGGWGPSLPETHQGSISQDQTVAHPFVVTDGGLIQLVLSSPAPDLDLILRRNGAVYARSEGSTSDEQIRVFFPPNGNYSAEVYGWSVTQNPSPYTLKMNVVQGRYVVLGFESASASPQSGPQIQVAASAGVPVPMRLSTTATSRGINNIVLGFGLEGPTSSPAFGVGLPILYDRPPAPTLAAEPVWTSGTQNTVFWSGSKATTYTVQCDTSASFTAPVAIDCPGNQSSSTVAGLTSGQTYYYRVRGRNGLGNGQWSNTVRSRQDGVAPTAVPPLNDGGAFTSRTTITFSWPPHTDALSGIASYDLQAGTSPGASNRYNANVGLLRTVNVTGAHGETLYGRVRARDVAGNIGAWVASDGILIDTVAPPQPAAPRDRGTATSSTSVRFDWNAVTDAHSGVGSYDLQVGTAPNTSNVFNANVGNVLTRTVTGAGGQVLYARVRARDRAGNTGAWSASSDGILVDTAKPRLLEVLPADNWKLTVRFNETVTGGNVAGNYAITRGVQVLQAVQLSGSQYRLHTTAQQPATSYTVTVRTAVKDPAGNPMDTAYAAKAYVSTARTGARSWELYR
ncbi:MAG: S8 family serine peptidase [Candidatus Sumerlaeia bacterium]|nr:S8 family serine peptidase [Candidatus Sumerlaeia bacterium]